MSLKMKLTSTVCAFFLILGLVIMGVFASPQASVNLGGTITFHATDVYANVYGSITGAVESVDAGGTLSLTTLNFEAGETTDTSSWANVPLTFKDNGGMITISITIENLATDRPLYATINDNYGAVTNVTKGMKKGEATYTGDCLTIPQKSGDDTNKVTINLTMEVKDKNFSLVDGLRYGYIVDLSNEEIEVPVVRTNSESLGTVTSSVTDGVLTVEVQPQEGAQFVGFRKTASGTLQASAVSSGQEFLNFNIIKYGAITLPYLAVDFGFDEAVAMDLVSRVGQNTFMDYSIYLANQDLVDVAQQLLENMPEEEMAFFESVFPGLTQTLNILVTGDTSYTFGYVEGDKYQAVFSTCETVENENGYNYVKFPDAGFSIIKGFDLPDGQPTDVTLASALGGYKVLGITNNWAKALETNAFSPFTDKCTSITFPDSYTIYPDAGLCSDLTKLKTVKLGKNMTSIGYIAFNACSGLTSITIPSSVTSIGFGAFSDCSGLTSITIPSSVTSIGDSAFGYCSGLTSITIPSGVTSIGAETFTSCNKLVEIINKSGVEITNESHGLNADDNPNIRILSSEEDSTLEQVGDFLFYNYNGTNYLVHYLGHDNFVTLPESYKDGSYEIRSYAIFGDANIVEVTIPSAVSGIGRYAVTNCQHLVEVVNKSQVSFPIGSLNYSPDRIITNEEESTVEIVDDYIFYKNGSVNYLVHYVGNETNLVLPDNFKGEDYQIRQYTFQYYDWLTSVSIGTQCTRIGDNAFDGCSGLTDIYYTGTQEEWSAITIDGSGNDALTSATIHYGQSMPTV